MSNLKTVAVSTSKEFCNSWFEVSVDGGKGYNYCVIGRDVFGGHAVYVKGAYVAHGYEHIMNSVAYNKQRVTVFPVDSEESLEDTVSPWVTVDVEGVTAVRDNNATVVFSLAQKLLKLREELGLNCEMYFHRKARKHVLKGETYLGYASENVKVRVSYDPEKDVQVVEPLSLEAQAFSDSKLLELLASKIARVVDSI